jgi:hypothetical protein
VSPTTSTVSVTVPLALACLVLIGHALRERSSALLFVAGLLVSLTAGLTTWQLSLVQSAGLRWVPVAQACLVAGAAFALLWLAFQRHFVIAWPSSGAEDALLSVQAGLAAVGTVVLLSLPLGWMFLKPAGQLPAVLGQVGEPGGWLAGLMALAATLWLCRRRHPALTPHVVGVGGVGLAVLAATLAGRLSSDGATSWLVLLACGALLGLAWAGALILDVRRKRSEAAAQLWAEVMAAALILLGGRSGSAAVALPWTSPGPVLLAGVLFGTVAVLVRSAPHVLLSGLCLCGASLLGWLKWGVGSVDEAALVLASSLAVGATFWFPLKLRLGLRTRFPHGAALAGLGLLALVAVLGWLGGQAEPAALAWVTFALVVTALLAGLWDEGARLTLPGLYLAGLVGVVMVLRAAGGDRLETLGSLALTAHVLTATMVCRLGRRLEALATSLGLAPWVSRGPVRDWWLGSQSLLAGLIVLLSAGLSLTAVEWPDRLAGASSALLLLLTVVSFASLVEGRRQDLARLAGLALGPLVLFEAGAVLLPPVGVGGILHHAALAFSTLVLCHVMYRDLLPRRLPGGPWGVNAREVGGKLAVAALVVLGALLLAEMSTFDPQARRTPLGGVEVIHAGLAMLALLVLSLREALRPAPAGEKEQRGRTHFVYGAEVLLVLLFVHLRWNVPTMREATPAKYWPILIMGLAFGGAALGELFRRRGLDVLAVPLHRTGLALPVLPLLAFWLRPTPEMLDQSDGLPPGLKVLLAPLVYLPEDHAMQALLWFVTALELTGVAIARRSFFHCLAAALTANVGLWLLLAHHGVGIVLHPQLWLVPLGLIVLVSEYVNREYLEREQRLALRYVGLLLLYVSSTADLFLNGVGTSAVLPLALAVLAVVGVLAGLLLRVRAFLFMGVLFLAVDVMSMIWYAAVDRTQTWVWYVSGIVLGGAILALFAVFEKRREDVLRLVEELKSWD